MSDTKNELETLLEKAATEPAHRPAFFSALLEATVWVPGRAADGEQIVEDSALDLQHWEKDDGTSVIPFFTSLEALQQAVADEQAFVMMPARTLMAMTLGESLFLNPKLPSGKEFTPREISHLLGEEGSPLSTQTVLEGGEALLLLLLLHITLPIAVNIRCSVDGVDKAVDQVLFAAQLDAGVNRPIDASQNAFVLAVRFMVLHDQHQDTAIWNTSLLMARTFLRKIIRQSPIRSIWSSAPRRCKMASVWSCGPRTLHTRSISRKAEMV